MIEVIGKDQSKYKQLTCYKCASILKYTMADTEKRKFDMDYLGDYNICDSIKCPVCNKLLKA